MMFPIKNRTFEQILGFSISEMYYFSPRPTVKREIDQLLQKESLLLNGAQLILEAGTMPLLVIFFSINSCIVRCWLLIYVIEEGIPCNILI